MNRQKNVHSPYLYNSLPKNQKKFSGHPDYYYSVVLRRTEIRRDFLRRVTSTAMSVGTTRRRVRRPDDGVLLKV